MRTSLPSRATGIARAWTRVGCFRFKALASVRPRTSLGSRYRFPNAVQDAFTACFCCVLLVASASSESDSASESPSASSESSFSDPDAASASAAASSDSEPASEAASSSELASSSSSDDSDLAAFFADFFADVAAGAAGTVFAFFAAGAGAASRTRLRPPAFDFFILSLLGILKQWSTVLFVWSVSGSVFEVVQVRSTLAMAGG